MKKLLLSSLFFLGLTVGHGQTDSSKTQEISFGISVIPPLYPGFGNSSHDQVPTIGQNRMRESYYSVPVNINYRFQKKNKGKNNLSFIAVVPTNANSDLSYYAISYGRTIANLNKKRTFTLNGDLLIGYLKYNGWVVSGGHASPKEYKGADLLLTGINIGLTAHHKLTSRLFLENEIYFLTYYTRGSLYYYDRLGIGTTTANHIGLTFSKLLAINLGYKF